MAFIVLIFGKSINFCESGSDNFLICSLGDYFEGKLRVLGFF